MPAPNGAGGVEDVRQVQWHLSRISVSAMQTLKYKVGPSYGGPTTPLTAILAGGTARNRMAVRGSESPMAAQQAAPPWGIPRAAENRRETAGFPVLTAAEPPRQNAQGSTASLLAVHPRSPALAVFTARVGMTPFVFYE
ncbi:hypothetical protein NDU88_003090 [Pleurodeles waltl]|uniref:Uncharacterized protein n=1 Tax=Pleurodeles waltl TaxID=8319 RepID=A0AAV7W4A6_PLEWA|nr:hypothetical protein NDU88_003090 [Pleurodeles waltl]